MQSPNKPRVVRRNKAFCQRCRQPIKQGKQYYSRGGKAFHYPRCKVR